MELPASTNGQIILTNPKIYHYFKDCNTTSIENVLLSFIDCMESATAQKKNGNNICKSPPPPAIITPATPATPTVTDPNPVPPSAKEDSVTINKYVMEEIQKEYHTFFEIKDEMIGFTKDNYKRAMDMIENMTIPSLEKCIGDFVPRTIPLKMVNQMKCELCNYYICNTRKAMSAHQRGCKKYVGSL
jgi:hypothetical protein